MVTKYGQVLIYRHGRHFIHYRHCGHYRDCRHYLHYRHCGHYRAADTTYTTDTADITETADTTYVHCVNMSNGKTHKKVQAIDKRRKDSLYILIIRMRIPRLPRYVSKEKRKRKKKCLFKYIFLYYNVYILKLKLSKLFITTKI